MDNQGNERVPIPGLGDKQLITFTVDEWEMQPLQERQKDVTQLNPSLPFSKSGILS